MSRRLFVCSRIAVLILSTSRTPLRAQTDGATLLVLNKTDNTLAFVNPGSGQVTSRIPTGEGPHEVVVSTDGALAFVANYGATSPGNTISVIDLATRKEL